MIPPRRVFVLAAAIDVGLALLVAAGVIVALWFLVYRSA